MDKKMDKKLNISKYRLKNRIPHPPSPATIKPSPSSIVPPPAQNPIEKKESISKISLIKQIIPPPQNTINTLNRNSSKFKYSCLSQIGKSTKPFISFPDKQKTIENNENNEQKIDKNDKKNEYKVDNNEPLKKETQPKLKNVLSTLDPFTKNLIRNTSTAQLQKMKFLFVKDNEDIKKNNRNNNVINASNISSANSISNSVLNNNSLYNSARSGQSNGNLSIDKFNVTPRKLLSKQLNELNDLNEYNSDNTYASNSNITSNRNCSYSNILTDINSNNNITKLNDFQILNSLNKNLFGKNYSKNKSIFVRKFSQENNNGKKEEEERNDKKEKNDTDNINTNIEINEKITKNNSVINNIYYNIKKVNKKETEINKNTYNSSSSNILKSNSLTPSYIKENKYSKIKSRILYKRTPEDIQDNNHNNNNDNNDNKDEINTNSNDDLNTITNDNDGNTTSNNDDDFYYIKSRDDKSEKSETTTWNSSNNEYIIMHNNLEGLYTIDNNNNKNNNISSKTINNDSPSKKEKYSSLTNKYKSKSKSKTISKISKTINNEPELIRTNRKNRTITKEEYNQNTLNDNDNDNSINPDDIKVDYEDLLLIDERINKIISYLESNNANNLKFISIECIEWWNFFTVSNLYINNPITMINNNEQKITEDNRNLFIYCTSLLMGSIIICHYFIFAKDSINIPNINKKIYDMIANHYKIFLLLTEFIIEFTDRKSEGKYEEECIDNLLCKINKFFKHKSNTNLIIKDLKSYSNYLHQVCQRILNKFDLMTCEKNQIKHNDNNSDSGNHSNKLEKIIALFTDIRKKKLSEINEFFNSTIINNVNKAKYIENNLNNLSNEDINVDDNLSDLSKKNENNNINNNQISKLSARKNSYQNQYNTLESSNSQETFIPINENHPLKRSQTNNRIDKLNINKNVNSTKKINNNTNTNNNTNNNIDNNDDNQNPDLQFCIKDFSSKKNLVLPPTPRSLITPVTPYIKSVSLKKYSLVLDLDETLIHFHFDVPPSPQNASSNINPKGYLQLRPGLLEFLTITSNYYELILFTVATKNYADLIIEKIENLSGKKLFSHKLYREHVTIYQNDFVKDLSKIGRDLRRVIIVDDKPLNFCLQKDNGIAILPFWGNDSEIINDKALSNLLPILVRIAQDDTNDVRKEIKNYKEEIVNNVSSFMYQIN